MPPSVLMPASRTTKERPLLSLVLTTELSRVPLSPTRYRPDSQAILGVPARHVGRCRSSAASSPPRSPW